MYIDLKKTLAAIENCLPAGSEPTPEQLRRMYGLTQRLMSQELGAIYDLEAFGGPVWQEQPTLARRHSGGDIEGGLVTLTVREPLPAMKRLTEAVEEHWKAMLHAAISEAAQREPLPYFEKAFVGIEIVTPRGSDNTKVWDTSNRAIQVVLNNLKGIFFRDDDIEHMAFSVAGRWDEGRGETVIRVFDFNRSQRLWSGAAGPSDRNP